MLQTLTPLAQYTAMLLTSLHTPQCLYRPGLSLWQVPPSYIIIYYPPTVSHGPACHCGRSRLPRHLLHSQFLDPLFRQLSLSYLWSNWPSSWARHVIVACLALFPPWLFTSFTLPNFSPPPLSRSSCHPARAGPPWEIHKWSCCRLGHGRSTSDLADFKDYQSTYFTTSGWASRSDSMFATYQLSLPGWASLLQTRGFMVWSSTSLTPTTTCTRTSERILRGLSGGTAWFHFLSLDLLTKTSGG